MPPPFPAAVAAACAELRAAHADGATIAPCGRRTRLRRHRPRAAPDRWLESAGFRGVVWLDAADQTVEVGAGTSAAELDDALAESGWMLGVDAPQAGDGTLGGLFLAPDLSLLHGAYGPPRDQVLGGCWMLADGSVVRTGARVVKSVAGYDLTRLLLGSRGLLAVCISLTLRLLPPPRELRCARVADPLVLLRADLPAPLWHFQERGGGAWAAWEGFLPEHDALAEAGEAEFRGAKARTLAAFARLPRRIAHATTPAVAPAGPMDWSALQEGCDDPAVAPPGAVSLPATGAPAHHASLARACAPDAPAFADDGEETP